MNIEALKAQLIQDEGLRLKPYADTVGKVTIGVGRNLTDKGISAVEADELLGHDIADTVEDLSRMIPWWADLSDARQQVLANMAFNMGSAALMGFKRFLGAARIGDFNTASLEMLNSQWAVQVGDRSHRLAKMMREG